MLAIKAPRWTMYVGCLSPDVQMTNTTLRLFMQILTDLTATRTLGQQFMLMLAEYMQYFSSSLLFERIFCDNHPW
jgi:hypothetical protein